MLNNPCVLWLLAIYIFILIAACISLSPSKDKIDEVNIDIVPGDKWFKYDEVDLGEPGPVIVTIVSLTEEGDVVFKENSKPSMRLHVDVFLSLFKRMN